MPANYVKSLSVKYKIPIKSLEKYWKEAKKVITDYGKYDSNDEKKWGTIVDIFKNKINKHLATNESILGFKNYLQLEEDMRGFKDYIAEGLEDDIAASVIDKIGDKISSTIEDELIGTFRDRIVKKIQDEMNDTDSKATEGDKDEVDDENGDADTSTEPETTEGEKDTGSEDGSEETKDGEVPNAEETKDEVELEKNEDFVRKIASENSLEIEEVLPLWDEAKKECKFKPNDNQYWNSCTKIFNKKFKETFDIML